MKHWWCMECQTKVELNRQGRCDVCDSEGVDLLCTEDELSSSVSITTADPDSAAASA
jgi:Zn finger protein HypA/HybF involved in hydrogenase expression